MNSLIQVVNKLQDVFRTVDNMDNAIQLPQIAVVGTQVFLFIQNWVEDIEIKNLINIIRVLASHPSLNP